MKDAADRISRGEVCGASEIMADRDKETSMNGREVWECECGNRTYGSSVFAVTCPKCRKTIVKWWRVAIVVIGMLAPIAAAVAMARVVDGLADHQRMEGR